MGLGLLIAILLGVAGSPLLHGQQWGTHLDGTSLVELAPRDVPAVVLFFVATDCPISNRMFPEMRRLREEFSPRGARFWFVYPNTYETRDAIEAHQKDFDPGGQAIQDSSGELVRLSHAVATPEMSVFVPAGAGWKKLYSGPVDNRYVHIGLERPAATQHFGEDVLVAILSGRIVKQATSAPVGCAIINPGVQ